MRICKIALSIPFLLSSHTVSAQTCANAVSDSMSCCSSINADGSSCAAPADSQYSFTLRRFGFESSTGEVTWVGSITSFNAADAAIGASMGAFISGTALPVGTYVAVQPEVNVTMTVNGADMDTSDGVTCSTGGAQTESLVDVMDTLGSPLSSCPSDASQVPSEGCNVGDGYMRMRDTSLGTITVTPNSSPTITFTFDVGSGLIYSTSAGGGGSCTFANMGPLDVSMSLAN